MSKGESLFSVLPRDMNEPLQPAAQAAADVADPPPVELAVENDIMKVKPVALPCPCQAEEAADRLQTPNISCSGGCLRSFHQGSCFTSHPLGPLPTLPNS